MNTIVLRYAQDEGICFPHAPCPMTPKRSPVPYRALPNYDSAMQKRRILLVLSAIALAACTKKAPTPIDIGSVLPNIPLPPQGQPLVREGGVDAMQFLWVSPVSPDSMDEYYRTALSSGAFRLINESKTGKATAFYAEQDGPSIWVTVSPNGTEGSQIMIAGATDSASKAAMKAQVPVVKTGDSGSNVQLGPKKPGT
jgi:hypothetical protein